MIISKTPVRITFVGGGTDYPEYFLREGGETLGMAIDRYAYITITPNEVSEHRFKVSYRKVETRKRIEDIEHPVVRACLQLLNIQEALQIYYVGDLPAGTGIGSSSAFTVSLLGALHQMRGEQLSNEALAMEATYVEQTLLGENVGCQDQMTCAVGGLVHLRYERDGSILKVSNKISTERLSVFQQKLLLVYTGGPRFASDIVSEQMDRTRHGQIDKQLQKTKAFVAEAKAILESGNDLNDFGILLDEAWKVKKEFSSKVSNSLVDDIYDTAVKAGALGGKLLGAGHGGFMLFFVDESKKASVKESLGGFTAIDVKMDVAGSVQTRV